MDIEQLNTEFGVDRQLEITEGAGGFHFIQIDTVKANAVISIYGGQVLSFRPAREPHDLMFLSKAAHYQDGKAIKGGAPICWPWFGPDPEGAGRPLHGFARNRFWNLAGTEAKADGDVRVMLEMADTPETREVWPHGFRLALEITVGDSLTMELTTRNTGREPFSITQAIHTYFKIGNIRQVVVLGLEDTAYIDKVAGGIKKRQEGAITIASEVDRIYLGAPNELVVDDILLDRRIRITSKGSKTAVVWNPWADLSRKAGDLEDNDYENMLCVETANAGTDAITIAPDSAFRLTAGYRIERYLPDVLERLKKLL